MIERVAANLREEARRTGERRLLVLTGDRDRCHREVRRALEAADIDAAESVLVSDDDRLVQPSDEVRIDLQTVSQSSADSLLGTTQQAVVLDAHDRLEPNVLGRTIGTVDGGGLYVILAPALEQWPECRDGFDETLAVPPATIEDVAGNFRRRLTELLRAHPGIAIVDLDDETVRRDGLTHAAARDRDRAVEPPDDTAFPAEAYQACLTTDQATALHALERLREDGSAVVVSADRGRGKSSAAGLAAGALASEGNSVLVTAPEYRSAAPLFDRATVLLDRLDALESPRAGRTGGADSDRDAAAEVDVSGEPAFDRIESTTGGTVRFEPPTVATDLETIEEADAVIVDEAAALPVARLEAFSAASSVAFVTTVHGYEGAGRGFSVRFRDRLAASNLEVTETSIDEPIRYAPGDPVEVWSFRALCFDARPAPDQLLADATPETVEYRALPAETLLEDEPLLAEVFGLLVLAHYRTEPNDLARLLDAPNVRVRALLQDGHVASVALLAREGGLDADLRARMYEGSRVRGNMLPDVLTGQLGDEAAAAPVGWRVMRIATHPACRSRGLGSRLLSDIEADATGKVDWVGTGFGATPELVAFWRSNGYAPVHLSLTRNDRSGEHSIVMLTATSDPGRTLRERHATGFVERIDGVLADALADLDPDVVRAVLRAAEPTPDPALDDADWQRIARMAGGPGLLDVDPAPFRRLALTCLLDPDRDGLLSARQERLLVHRVLQARGWEASAAALDFPSRRACMLATGDVYARLVEAYGNDTAQRVLDRFEDGV